MTSHENISPRDEGFFFFFGLFVNWNIANTRVVLGIPRLLHTFIQQMEIKRVSPGGPGHLPLRFTSWLSDAWPYLWSRESYSSPI